MIELINRATRVLDQIAIVDPQGEYPYHQLLNDSENLGKQLLRENEDLKEARVGFMVRPGYKYVQTQWAIWRAGGIAVPICVTYPVPSVKYVLDDAQVSIIVATEEFIPVLTPLAQAMNVPILLVNNLVVAQKTLPTIGNDRRAMILYTSGTTGKPKGVVSTHMGIQAQIRALVKAWEWSSDDHILNILPLHHVHGIINVLSCALWSGATCAFLPSFSPKGVFEVFKKGQVNLFMAVPTIYYKLIAHWEKLKEEEQKQISSQLRHFRLMVSGSAALPVSTLEKWRNISGQTLLERYGMTEMGMAISNPYQGKRKPGFIGQPLPGVTVRLVNEDDQQVAPGESGEIQVQGPNVFKEYWNKPEATRKTFTEDGWFKTGDIAKFEGGSYKILGRNSVDIIKSGGYKISALEVQEVLRRHPAIKDCGVVGIPDEEWGEIIAAAIITDHSEIDFSELKAWLKEYLPSYKVPRKYLIINELPRNVMGKVTKHRLKELF